VLIFGKVMPNTQRKIKVVAVFSLIEHANEFYWYAHYLNSSIFELHCIFLNPAETPVQKKIAALGIPCYLIDYSGKKDVLRTLLKTIRLLNIIKPDIIHPQLFDASFIALTAAWLAGYKNRLHTRHHSDIHHKYHPQAVKYDRWINLLSKKIICPSEQTKALLIEKENVTERKITVIRHGFDFDDFIVNENDKIEIMQKYKLTGFPLIGVVSRFTEWKGVQFTIKAFERILEKYPDAILVLAGVGGDYETEILNLLKQIPTKNYRIIKFEKDIYALFSTFNIFVHVPISKDAETFGQIYVEAFALKIPSVITLSGIAYDCELFKKYANVIDYMNDHEIFDAMIYILSHYKECVNNMESASIEVKREFTFDKKIKSIEHIYLSFFSVVK